MTKNAVSREFYTFAHFAPRTAVEGFERTLISVVLPVYNHASFLPDAIRSVLKATSWPCELIIVNDGSQDHFDDAIVPFSSHPQIKIINQDNTGLSAALNRGFRLARGQFLTWTSADNLYHAGALDELALFLVANPSVGLVYGNVQLIGDNGEIMRHSTYRQMDQDAEHPERLRLPLFADTLSAFPDNFINACFLYRREAAMLVGEYDASLNGLEDYDYWLRLSRYYRLAHVDTDDVLYSYRLHENSLTKSLSHNDLAERTAKRVRAEQSRLKDRSLARYVLAHGALPLGKASAALVAASLNNNVELVTREEFDKGAMVAQLTCATNDGHSPRLYFYANHSLAPFPEKYQKLMECCYEKTPQGKPFTDPLFVSTHPLGNAVRSSCSSGVILPPLAIPTIFYRARSSDFDAITPHTDSKATVLILNPERENESARAFVETLTEYTFAALCLTAEERRAADDINRGLRNNKNFRIVDLSAHMAEEQLINSLMFVFSSSSVALWLSDAHADQQQLLAQRGAAGICAAAGINLIHLHRFADETVIEYFGRALMPELEAISDSLSAATYTLATPNVRRIFEKSAQEQNWHALSRLIDEAKFGCDGSVAQQWLSEQSLARTGQLISNLVLA